MWSQILAGCPIDSAPMAEVTWILVCLSNMLLGRISSLTSFHRWLSPAAWPEFRLSRVRHRCLIPKDVNNAKQLPEALAGRLLEVTNLSRSRDYDLKNRSRRTKTAA